MKPCSYAKVFNVTLSDKQLIFFNWFSFLILFNWLYIALTVNSNEWSRLMRLQPPALEDVQVKPEIKPESVDDCMVDSESSPT